MKLKMVKIHPLPLGEGRVRASRFELTCDPHPPLRGDLSQRERVTIFYREETR